MPALQDASTLDNPVRVKAEPSVEVVVADHGVGHVAPGADDAQSHQPSAAGARRWTSVGGHDSIHLGVVPPWAFSPEEFPPPDGTRMHPVRRVDYRESRCQ